MTPLLAALVATSCGGGSTPAEDCVPTAEACDGVDNDCDGLVDEGDPGGGSACSTGLAGVCAAGVISCQGGTLACVQTVVASAEACDGVDNDCDGLVDEGVCAAPPGPGDLVITEFMANPNAVTDANGEWIEVLNPTAGALSLLGVALTDGGTGYTIPTSVEVPAGGRVVLCANTDPAQNGGVSCGLGYPFAQFSLANTGGTVMLSLSATVIDQVSYTSAWVVAGKSKELRNSTSTAAANDDLANWCDAVSLLNISDLGSPGATNSCP